MQSFEKLQINKNSGEFFQKLRFYSQINLSTGILNNLEIDVPGENRKRVTEDKQEIDKLAHEKYKKVFSDIGVKEVYPAFGNKAIDIIGKEVEEAMDRLNFKKAVSWDYIPGESYKLIREDDKGRKKEFEQLEDFYDSVAKALNSLIDNNEPIPEEILCSRLICLNKVPNEIGKIENIRPIAVKYAIQNPRKSHPDQT